MRTHTLQAIWQTVLTMVSIGLGSSVVLAQQPPSIGLVTALQGQATVQHAGNTQAMSLGVESPVYREDVIQTLAASKIKLLLLDGTELTLGEGSTMTLSKFVYTPQQQTHQGIIKVASGIFRAVTRKVFPQTTFEVHTATAVAAVRGTQWLGEVTPEATAITVVEGEVTVVHAETRIGGAVVLTPGQGTDVQGQQPPTVPKTWAAERVSRLLQATALP
jgi:hypothetical protein